ncbi:MAG: 30S ribosomal protein S5 [Parcubacteria group bacterium CG1_02_37_51]|uniref:Small ribosomal subunit protein uS5 n=2 Tax=Candidatus Komeiliibacteriota TaxID=1817908 RepID=A0A2M8DRI4_9BACT|nr:MAG: 30S ribosomal protein S5 [Parcubacteria group bacterium CG1_02_37_51]PIY94814.1 MAG: 30S ribosomal protein S5 [Candidatus Komeilibacteria bacterium CG_4_10_14_0_8_um_filter_37_78]PJC01994.1 MAG: 30S ribosomal protein S5 [Candidatus Komeilibacteria bacterium CG_4_9_14_0_8_um_filter_36_9]
MTDDKKKFNKGKRNDAPKDEFDQRIIDLARVTRVMAGGKRLRFRACVVVGDHKGKIGYGIAKGKDVTIAVNKAVNRAKKALITLKTIDGTIPHQVTVKYKAAKVMLRPAPVGTGIVAGGAVRALLELSGIQNISAKILGANNKINNIQATFKAFSSILDKPRPEAKEPAIAKTEATKETVEPEEKESVVVDTANIKENK